MDLMFDNENALQHCVYASCWGSLNLKLSFLYFVAAVTQVVLRQAKKRDYEHF
jgi:hypothetical protein